MTENKASYKTQRPAAVNEPEPTPGTMDVWPELVKDIEARVKMGLAKYGDVFQADNGRDSLMDAYQDALDLVIYLKAELMRRSKEG